MTLERWNRIKAIAFEAMELPAAEQAEFVRARCENEPDLLHSVERLMREESQSRNTLEQAIGRAAVELRAEAAPPASLVGQTISHYRITEKLGEGGMGVVYKAEDSKLGRTVALKFLSVRALANEEERARFVREAQAGASLDHPNIAAIYEIDEADGQIFIAMSYVDGPSLADKIKQRPLKIAEALDIAIQAGQGLQEAHEKGVVHRDVKSGNILLTQKGQVKITDFGLAHLACRAKITKSGTTMGTPAYMSPEQAQGQPTDRRSDVWSLGVVLYEMLTARLPFEGDHEHTVVYSIITEDPEPVTALRSGLPTEIDRIIAKALAKSPDGRYSHVDDLNVDLRALAGALRTQTPKAYPAGEGGIGPWPASTWARIRARLEDRQRVCAWLITAVAVLSTLVFAVLWRAGPAPTRSSPAFVANLTMDLAPAKMLGPAVFYNRPSHTAFAISPDDTTVVFSGVAADGDPKSPMLYRRRLAETQAAAIPGTEGAEYPFFSPDGQWVGFAASAKLKKVAIGGGPPIDLCDLNGRIEGANWGPSGIIAFAMGTSGVIAFAKSGLWTIPDSGGKPEAVFQDDGNSEIYSPILLPDGQTVLFTAIAPPNWGEAHVDSIELTTKQRKTLLINAADARYSPTGHLVFMRNATLLAVPFDAARVEVLGAPVPLLAGIMQSVNAPNSHDETGMGQVALSRSGTLVYAAGGIYPTDTTSLLRVDRNGRQTKLAETQGSLLGLRLSPDGNRVVGFRGDGSRATDLWLYDLRASTSTRLTSTGVARWPLFSPDGNSVTFHVFGAKYGIYSLPLNANSKPQRIMESQSRYVAPASWSPDGTWLAYMEYVNNVLQIVVRATHDLRPDSEADSGEPRQFSPSAFYQQDAYFSPDGRWIVYVSNESGAYEVYVQPFPGPGEKHRISPNGGVNPAWSHDGQELFHLKPKPETRNLTVDESVSMMAVDVSTTGGFTAGRPRQLFEGPYGNTAPLRSYDVTPDGQFLMMTLGDLPDHRVTKLNVVLGWAEELKRRVPTR